MNPLKRKDLVAMTASQLNMPAEQVDDIISFYYASLQRKLSSTEHTTIQVPNLGTFVLKRKALGTKIDRLADFIARLESEQDSQNNMGTFGLIQTKKQELANYNSLWEKVETEKERKVEVTLRKIAFKENANPK